MQNSDDIDLRKIFPLAINEIQKMIEQKIKIVSMIKLKSEKKYETKKNKYYYLILSTCVTII